MVGVALQGPLTVHHPNGGHQIWHGIRTAAQFAASITFLLSDDGTNVNVAILASDGGWSAL